MTNYLAYTKLKNKFCKILLHTFIVKIGIPITQLYKSKPPSRIQSRNYWMLFCALPPGNISI